MLDGRVLVYRNRSIRPSWCRANRGRIRSRPRPEWKSAIAEWQCGGSQRPLLQDHLHCSNLLPSCFAYIRKLNAVAAEHCVEHIRPEFPQVSRFRRSRAVTQLNHFVFDDQLCYIDQRSPHIAQVKHSLRPIKYPRPHLYPPPPTSNAGLQFRPCSISPASHHSQPSSSSAPPSSSSPCRKQTRRSAGISNAMTSKRRVYGISTAARAVVIR